MAIKEREKRNITPTRILSQLRIDIMSGKYLPGQPLIEEELAKDFGAARGSVRTALQTLAAERLINFLPNGRKQVLGFSTKQALDMYELRLLLEGKAIQIIFEANYSAYGPLVEVLGRIEKLYKERNPETDWYDLDIQYHRAIVEMADNIPLRNAWEVNASMIYALMQLNTTKGYKEQYIDEFLAKHRELFSMIVARDPICLDQLRTHILDAKQISWDVLKRFDTSNQGNDRLGAVGNTRRIHT